MIKVQGFDLYEAVGLQGTVERKPGWDGGLFLQQQCKKHSLGGAVFSSAVLQRPAGGLFGGATPRWMGRERFCCCFCSLQKASKNSGFFLRPFSGLTA